MVTVQDAEQIIMRQVADFGNEDIHFQQANGRVLAHALLADRDLPPANRATMDGIAITYEAIRQGIASFTVKGLQSAADAPLELSANNECIEIMTGAALALSADTVVRYEDLDIQQGIAALQTTNIKQGQNVHKKAIDKKAGDIIIPAQAIITPAIIGAAAFTGKEILTVKRQPRILLCSNGDELVEVNETPPPYKIRRSNIYALLAALQQFHLPADSLHLPDDEKIIEQALSDSLKKYDVVILSGGVSMGKYDLIAKALESLSVKKLFHKVQQRPGKPFWFGAHEKGTKVFAFPGNPVSTFMCFYRYFIPWYKACMGLDRDKCYALLAEDFSFAPPLQYFLQVKVWLDDTGRLMATPLEGNGSGDLSNLAAADAFMELPLGLNNFKKGEAYPLWPFKPLFI